MLWRRTLPAKAESTCCLLTVLQMDYLRPGFMVIACGQISTLALRIQIAIQLHIYFSVLHIVDRIVWLNESFYCFILRWIAVSVLRFDFFFWYKICSWRISRLRNKLQVESLLAEFKWWALKYVKAQGLMLSLGVFSGVWSQAMSSVHGCGL